jgi:cytochrome c556
MIRKWMAFVLSAGILVTLGLGAGLSRADDDKESELEQIMEKVQKHNADILKGIRNLGNFKKSQKDVVKSSKELVKLAKKSKPLKDAFKNAKNEKDPAAKWTEFLDAMIKESEKFEGVAAKPETTYIQAKDAYKAVQKTCNNCHDVFKGEDDKF